MAKKIGFIPGGFKPFTKGHYFLVEKAAQECDSVYLVVGQGDRVRPGEFPITGDAMTKVWQKYLIPAMPGNVKVVFAPSPIRFVWEKLGEADKKTNETADLYVVFGDNKDLADNFKKDKLEKYVPTLLKQKRLVLKPFERASGVHISGTMMRKYLQLGLKDDFIAGLPAPVQSKGSEIFALLGGKEA